MNNIIYNVLSMVAILIGSIVIGYTFGAGAGWGVGLIAYGLRQIED
jgi:hypothetical protein